MIAPVGMAAAISWTTMTMVFAAADPRALERVEQAARAREAGRLEESLALMREAYALDPQPLLLNNAGALLEQLGRYDEAYETFEQVLASKNIPPELRKLDEERVARLRPKLGHAHVLFLSENNAGRTLILGATPIPLPPNTELAVPPQPGRTLAALYDRERQTASFRILELHPGRRTAIKEHAEDRDRGMLIFDPPNARMLEIDGKKFIFEAGLARAELDEKFYELQTRWDENSAPIVWRGNVRRGIQAVITASKAEARLIEAPPAAIAKEAAPVWPWISAGGGAIAAGVAVALFAGAASDVATVNDRANSDGVVLGLDRARAEELDASAAAKGRWGVVLSITGVVAIAAGIGGLVF